MADLDTVVEQGIEAAFTKAELEGRQAAARRVLAAKNIDVMIVTGPENIFYLTGQQTPGYYTFQALLLPCEGDPVFLIRQLEALNCRANSFLQDFVTYQDDQTPSEALVFKCYDSARDGRARFLPHTGFDDVATPADAASRESIETRSLVFF